MKLQDRLPDGVTVDGRFYRLDFDFRNVLRMLEEMDEDVFPEAKAHNALSCLCKRPKNALKVYEAVQDLLFDKPSEKGQRVTDFVQDAGLIRAAFRQEYGIDLYRDKLHWIEFIELLCALPEGNRYTDVISIRAREVPLPTKWNQKEREWLIREKAKVALKDTKEEQAEKYRHDVDNIAAFMMSMAKGSDWNG